MIEKDMYGGTVYFAATRSQHGDLVIVISNQDVGAKKTLKIYRKRWSIEELFRKLKTSGFNWENTHTKAPERLETLLIIMCYALLILSFLGLQGNKLPWRKTLNCPLYTVFKKGLIDFGFFAAKSMILGIEMILKLMDWGKNHVVIEK